MATINDVAKLAGVSRGTVSNVINGQKVRPESKKRVEEAMAELNYIPNAYARSLKTQKSETVALILPSIWVPFFSKFVSEVEEALRKYRYKLILCISHNDHRREIEYIQMAQENKVDGILLITYSDLVPYLKDETIPMVAIERFFNREIAFISTDNYKGGEMAAQEFIRGGCQKVCFVGRGEATNKVSSLRRDGFVNYCREHQVDCDVYYPESSSEDFPGMLVEWVNRTFSENQPYDGIFAAVDRYAEYFQDALRQTRPDLVIGEDLQLIGFDGIPASENQKMKISSIRQPVETLAVQAVEMLMQQIRHENCSPFVLIEPAFVEAGTTKKAD